jgi:branched-chain amino acid transport system substrate-binding protein
MNKTSGTNFKKVGVLCEDSVVGDSCAKALEKYTKEMNYTLVDVVKYNAATTKDFTGVLLRYKVKGVELIAGHNKPADTIQIVRNCKEVGFNPAMIGGVSGGWTAPELLGSLGPLAEGICIASSESPNPALGKFPEIVKWYEKEHNEPLASATFVNGISGAWLIYLALEKCGSNDPKIIAKTLRTLDVKYGDGYYFMLDGCKFDEKGDNTRASATVFQVQNNTRKTVYPLELATTKTIWPRPKFK